MNIEELRTQTKRFFDFDTVFACPANLDSDGEIVINMGREPKLILSMDIWKDKIVVFYEEKPMFVVIGMVDQSLSKTIRCDTFEVAVEAAVKIVKDWQIAELEDNDEEIRECLHVIHEYHFTDRVSVHDYSVYIGQPE